MVELYRPGRDAAQAETQVGGDRHVRKQPRVLKHQAHPPSFRRQPHAGIGICQHLAIDLDRQTYGADWNSGWQRQGRIDEAKHIWYAAARVPLKSVSDYPVKPGTAWRANLYRIDGLGEDPQRHFMCWQQTCVVNRDPNHVPEHFGTLRFAQ